MQIQLTTRNFHPATSQVKSTPASEAAFNPAPAQDLVSIGSSLDSHDRFDGNAFGKAVGGMFGAGIGAVGGAAGGAVVSAFAGASGWGVALSVVGGIVGGGVIGAYVGSR